MAKKHLYRKIEKIEAKENIGSHGEWRREFCLKYRKRLNQVRHNCYNSFVKKIFPKGQMVSCRKSCTYCCFHYVATPLAHGMVIVDYLYRNNELLKQFICNYKKWRHKGYDISNSIDHMRIQAFSSSMPIDDIIAITRPFSTRYLGMGIPCPFLVENSCLIYDVRPFPCSGQYSVSPPDWCDPASGKKPDIYQLIPDDDDLMYMLQLADSQLMLYEISLPILIFKLLTEGIASVERNALSKAKKKSPFTVVGNR